MQHIPFKSAASKCIVPNSFHISEYGYSRVDGALSAIVPQHQPERVSGGRGSDVTGQLGRLPLHGSHVYQTVCDDDRMTSLVKQSLRMYSEML